MVAIIDDREDIWGRCANLVHVKPYVFFAGTADINSPPSSRRDSRQPQASQSRPSEIRPQQQRFVQTVTHENKVDVTDNSNNNNNTSDKEDERSRGKEDEENESSSSSSSDSSSSDTDNSSSEEESEGDKAKQQASTAGIQNVHSSGSSPTALEKHPSGQEETATAHTVPDAHTIQPVSNTQTTKPEPGTGPRTKIDDPDKFLLSLEKILQRVHVIFYTECDSVQQTNTPDRRGSCGDDIPTPDLKVIIPRFRKSVLEGARLVFTGVIPTNMPLERSREWNTARAFGAVVQPQLISGRGKAEITSEATTHLIVGRPGTNKHRQALKMKGVKVVHSKWLWACAEQWEWVDETLFAPDFPPEVATKPAKEKKELEVKEQSKTHQIEEESPSKGSSDPSLVSISVLQMGAGSSRHRSHRFSVSSEELEKMEAEINRELSIEEEDDDESEEEEEDRLGSCIGNDNQTESMDTSEQYLGLETNSLELGRKRKYDEVEISSSNSNSPEDHSQSVRVSEDEEDDELADLLGL